jgi:hypothetical protein
MKILDNQLNDTTLSRLGIEAVGLLLSGSYVELAHRFGYAMTYERVPAEAIKEDFASCLQTYGWQALDQTEVEPSVVVKYFKPNESALLAVVECTVQMDAGAQVLLELVASRGSDGIYLTLEDLNVEPNQEDTPDLEPVR